MNSLLAIKYSLVSFLFTITITVLSVNSNNYNADIVSTLVGFIAFAIIILSIIGVIKSVKSINEKKRFQVIFGFAANLFFLALYSYLIISNI
jgi:hypothetical protein